MNAFPNAFVSPVIRSLLVAAAICAISTPSSARSACHAPNASTTIIADYMRRLVHATGDDDYVGTRERYGIATVPDSEIVVVSDDATCRSARATLMAAWPGVDASAPVYVVRAGTVYVAWVDAPPSRTSEFSSYMVMDARLREIVTFAS